MNNQVFLTFDIEDWFQVENLKGQIQKCDWDKKKLRVEDNTKIILDLLDKHNQKATFFVLGWIAERKPKLIKEIYDRGHEIASHGYGHDLIYNITKKQFRKDLKVSKNILEEIIDDKIYGYRAPSFSISNWSLKILKEEGFVYDSSYFPASYHDRYSKININLKNNFMTKIKKGFYEIPISTYQIFNKEIPIAGGGYFRLLPFFIYKYLFKRSINQKKGGIFYLHPWEIDYKQPKVKKLKFSYKFRHYYGQKKCLKKLDKLLKNINFTKIECIINKKEDEGKI